MFLYDFKPIIILNISLLILVNIILVISIYYVIIRDNKKEKKYNTQRSAWSPLIISYIENEELLKEVKKAIEPDFLKDIAADILIDYSDQNNQDLSAKFIHLDLDIAMINRLNQKMDIKYLKQLAFMRSERAYSFLMKTASSNNYEFSYMSLIGLSMIALEKDKKIAAIKKLILSDLASDRKIEILRKFNFSTDELFELLEREETSKGKVIFLKNILEKRDIKITNYSDRLLKYLNDDLEVRAAAVLALCESTNEKYADTLSHLYDKEESWEVRVSIAKGLSNFRYDVVKDLLQKMTKDREWWVRYNAIKSIVTMGSDGLFTLIELSLDEDKNISDLAYYFLNSNKDVYNTVKNIEV